MVMRLSVDRYAVVFLFTAEKTLLSPSSKAVVVFRFPIGQDTHNVTHDHTCARNQLRKHQAGILFGHTAHPATPKHQSLLRQELVRNLIDFWAV
jgi:hypothetical protein